MAVASSISSTRRRRSTARANDSSWRWPIERLPPPSLTGMSREEATPFSCTSSRARQISASEWRAKGSRLNLSKKVELDLFVVD